MEVQRSKKVGDVTASSYIKSLTNSDSNVRPNEWPVPQAGLGNTNQRTTKGGETKQSKLVGFTLVSNALKTNLFH